jgi:hypothetical protein
MPETVATRPLRSGQLISKMAVLCMRREVSRILMYGEDWQAAASGRVEDGRGC